MATFLGSIEVRSDDKGRLFIPAAYRKILSEMNSHHIIMRQSIDDACLIFYPESVWNAKVEALKQSLDEWNGDDQLLLMQFMAQAEILDTDSQGRVLLQKKQIEFLNNDSISSPQANHDANTDNKLLFVGMMDRFALWNPDVFASRQLGSRDLSDRIREKMKLYNAR